MPSRSRTSDDVEQTLAGIALARLTEPRARVLVVNAADGDIAQALATRGASVASWDRVACPGRSARPWPVPGEFDEAVLRMPRAREAFEMALHAVAARLVVGGTLWVFGSNDEGIRSAPRRIESLFENVSTAAARGHGRLFRARRRDELTALRGELRDFRTVHSIVLRGKPRDWVTYPGLFARGGVDAATALLIETLPPLPAGCRALDFGCGTGIIGAALEERGESVQLEQLDADAVAVEAARENVPAARAWLGSHLDDLPATLGWDRVVSNPPIHESVMRSYRVLEELAAAIGARLAPGGEVWLVCQRQVPVKEIFGEVGQRSRVCAERGAFRVWQVQR